MLWTNDVVDIWVVSHDHLDVGGNLMFGTITQRSEGILFLRSDLAL